ncbi:MAG: cation:dicarboxylase symporter family transporter [Halioglobus sp.]|nr:cation:dicarboxylase symporter family transporter [Halioglobus sp.]
MSLSARIFLGLGLGIATGLFFGELVSGLEIFGDIFIKLLQTTVLPYIVLSLISGIGHMAFGQARTLVLRGTLVLLLIWALGMLLIFIAAQAFPTLETASFFSSVAPHQPLQTNLVEVYLPANIFYSLSNNFVPAVVLFSILMGFALISVKDKDGVLLVFDSLVSALAKINRAIVQLTPYGIFAIAAAAAGTMTIEEVARVQVYLITYISLALLITFWIFPGLVAALSGIPFGLVLSTFRDTLVTAFATGNQFVVLPQIAENCKKLVRSHMKSAIDTDAVVDILVPVSFNFPSLGKLLVILFILFAAWFSDTEMNLYDSVNLAFTGLFSLFGSINVAVPYLLDTLQVPGDMFHLFLVTGIVVGRFGAMLAALHIIVLSILATLALAGALRFDLRKLLQYIIITTLAMLVLVIGLRTYFIAFVPEPPTRSSVLASVQLMETRVPANIQTAIPDPVDVKLAGSRLDHVLTTGLLRVGYRPNNLPCSFLTSEGELVGFDVEMAHILAEDIAASLEFVPFDFDKIDRMLASGQIDLAMSCIAGLPDRYTKASFSRPYLDLTLALIVPDHDRRLFEGIDNLRENKDLTIAMISSHYFEPLIRSLLPNAGMVFLDSAEDFFDGNSQGANALLLSAEEGAAYSYRYPLYTVIRVDNGAIQIPAVYAVPKGDIETMEFVSNWVYLKQKDGTIERLYDYWMLGGAAKTRQPRWSVIRDVLGWIE